MILKHGFHSLRVNKRYTSAIWMFLDSHATSHRNRYICLQGSSLSSQRSTTMAEVKKIMVAVDDSEFSHYALQWALSNLHLYGSDVSLVVFHAQPLAVFNSAATMGVTSPELIETLLNQQRQVSEAILARAKEMCAEKNVIVETVSEIGDPKDAICDAIEKLQIDLLIIGSHGYGMLKRAFLGSVSNYCVHYAKCPVLVTKKPS